MKKFIGITVFLFALSFIVDWYPNTRPTSHIIVTPTPTPDNIE